MAITLQFLVDNDACDDEISIFKSVFGDRAEVTIENFDRAVEVGLDLEWLINRIVEPEVLKRFKAAKAAAFNEYKAICLDLNRRIRSGQPGVPNEEWTAVQNSRKQALGDYIQVKKQLIKAVIFWQEMIPATTERI